MPFNYSEVADVLDRLTDGAQSDMSLIIRHYTEMLRRRIVPDETMEDIARQLYQRHKEAFDFVFDCRPTPESLIGVAREVMTATPGLVEDRHIATILRFTPVSWSQVPQLNACPPTLWTRTGRTPVFEIKTFSSEAYGYSDRVALILVVGPASQDIREKLYNGARDRPKTFVGLVKPMGKQYATIYSRDLLSSAEAKDMEVDQKIDALKAGWQRFLENDFPAIEKAVLDIVAH